MVHFVSCRILGRHATFVTSYMAGRENKRTNNRTILPSLKSNAVAGYKGPVKKELLKGAWRVYDSRPVWSRHCCVVSLDKKLCSRLPFCSTVAQMGTGDILT